MCLELHPQQVERREGAREGARERESERESVCVRACVCMCFASRTCACISPACAGPPRSTKALRCVYTCRSKGDRCAAIASACPRAPACRTSTSATSSTARRTAYAAAGAAMHANTALRTHPPPPARPPAPRPRRPRRRGSARGRRCAPSRAASREGPQATACFRGGAALCAHAAPPAAAE